MTAGDILKTCSVLHGVLVENKISSCIISHELM